MATAAASQRPTQTENIIKQGYLKKSVQAAELIPSASKQLANNIMQKFEPNRWYVFGVRNRRPYLEYFDKEESVFTGHAIHTYDLSTFQNLSYTMGRTNTNFTFCIFLADNFIDLTAPSRAHMVDWCRSLERHLRNLGLRSKHQKEDHQYTAFPVKKIPRPPAEDPPDPIENEMDQFLVDNANFDSDENDYQDPMDIISQDDGEGNNDDTLPIRPPPRVPKRQGEEDVFADLSTVRREEMYGNLEGRLQGHNSEITENEKHLFSTDSDASSNSDDECDIRPHAIHDGNKRHHDDGDDEDDDDNKSDDDHDESADRCTSLPDMHQLHPETDTSEDSDFMSASFWLRNRKPDCPEVPLRPSKVSPKPHPRKCVSMNVNLMTFDDDNLYDHPAPRKHGSLNRKKSDESTLVIVDQDVKCDNGNTVVLIDESTDDSDAEIRNHVATKIDKNDDNDQSFDASEGEYETLAKTPFHDRMGDIPDETCKKPGVDNSVGGEELYEAAWMCRTVRKLSDGDDDCCKKDFVVDLPKDNDVKDKCGASDDKCQAPSGAKSVPNGSSKENHKHKGLFSRFSKKSKKSKELPERLIVEMPPRAHNGCGNDCSNDDAEQPDGNFYSDLPGTGGDNPALDSDIRKLSLLENGPNETNDETIELPPRHFSDDTKFKTVVTVTSGAQPKQRNMSKSVGDSSQCFSMDAYEPIDVSKTADAYRNRPPVPIPEKSHTRNLINFDSGSLDAAPVAPPRKKMSDKMSASGSSPELPERKPRGSISPPIPRKRQSMYTGTSSGVGSVEPAVPPRPHHAPIKPALPPPHRPPPISRAASDVTGTRPKSVHLASRQQSTSQPSAVHVMNLKQNQVDILRSEIESTGGLVKLISKVHFQNGLAFVECFGKIWIAGWDVKRFPKLYDKFHIGDELISINDVHVSDLSFANKLIKNVKAESVEITIRRLPNARVFAIQRSQEGESLGIMREGGTAEIIYVDPSGLASKHGLPSKAATLDGHLRCNWCLTEINMRALNLFFKDKEIEHRLLAVGRDISIVVQPADFIRELKKQLKKHKNHKDYIIH